MIISDFLPKKNYSSLVEKSKEVGSDVVQRGIT
jgi:hypothetical protein